MTSRSSPSVLVHASPPLLPLPASDVESIRLLASLRASGVVPGVTTADWADNGKPFTTSSGRLVTPEQLSSLPGWRDPDAQLSKEQKADAFAWSSYIDGQVTDLIYHTMYSLPPNYPYLAGAQLATLPFPLSQYVPQRLRSIHRTRLEAVGLWGVGGQHDGDSPDEDRKRLEDSIVVTPGGTKVQRGWAGWRSGRENAERTRKFGEEKIKQRATAAFEPLARKLADNKFFLGSKLSSLDIALFSNLTVALSPEWPNTLLADYLRSDFPSLVKHHDRVLKVLYPEGWASVTKVAPPTPPSFASTLFSLLPPWVQSWTGGGSKPAQGEEKVVAKAKLDRGRWLWFAGAGLTFLAYTLATRGISITGGSEVEYIYVDDDDDEGIELDLVDDDE